MGKKNVHSLKRYQKELKRKEKASEKLARKQGKKDDTLKDFEEQDLTVEKRDEI
jgi:hypothetical protein